MEKNLGAATQLHDVTALPPKLEDLGISKIQSSRWQTEAKVPEEIFQKHVAEVNMTKQELTSTAVEHTPPSGNFVTKHLD